MRTLEGRTALVTGAGGGFGREIVRQLLEAGCRVVPADLDGPALASAIEEVLAAGPGAGARDRIPGLVVADLSAPDGADVLHARYLEVAGDPAPDLLINNAGVGLSGPISDIPREKWERLMQVNLLAPMRLTALFLPAMIERGSGHLVNVSSAAGLVGAPELSAYCASKFGLRGFGEALAAELRPLGIRVTNVYPYFSRTPILDSERYGRMDPKRLPDRLIYDPAFVVAELIRGVRKDRLHVFPGWIPRQIDLLRRWAPWALRYLDRALGVAARGRGRESEAGPEPAPAAAGNHPEPAPAASAPGETADPAPVPEAGAPASSESRDHA